MQADFFDSFMLNRDSHAIALVFYNDFAIEAALNNGKKRRNRQKRIGAVHYRPRDNKTGISKSMQ